MCYWPLEKAFPKLDLSQPDPFFFLTFLSTAVGSCSSLSVRRELPELLLLPEIWPCCWYCCDPCELAEFTDDIESFDSCRGSMIPDFFSFSPLAGPVEGLVPCKAKEQQEESITDTLIFLLSITLIRVARFMRIFSCHERQGQTKPH